MTEEKDKGLKEALRRQQTFRLPTNFTYRMMQQISEEIDLKEKRQEKRLFILMVIVCVLMIGVLAASIGYLYEDTLANQLTEWSSKLKTEPSRYSLDDSFQRITSLLPVLAALPVLAWFNHWLRKTFTK